MLPTVTHTWHASECQLSPAQSSTSVDPPPAQAPPAQSSTPVDLLPPNRPLPICPPTQACSVSADGNVDGSRLSLDWGCGTRRQRPVISLKPTAWLLSAYQSLKFLLLLPPPLLFKVFSHTRCYTDLTIIMLATCIGKLHQ